MTEETEIVRLDMGNAYADTEKFKQEMEEDWIVDDIEIEIVKLEPYHDEHCLGEERLMTDQVVNQQGFTLSYADVASMCKDEIEIEEVKVQSFYESDEAESASLAPCPLKSDSMNNISSEIARVNTSTGSKDLELALSPRHTSGLNSMGKRKHLADQNSATLYVDLNSSKIIDSNPSDEPATKRPRRVSQRITRRVEKGIQLNDKNSLVSKQQEKTKNTKEDGSNLRKQCPECRKTISAKYFKKHLTAHTTFASIQCEICKKSFKHKQTLVEHNAIHHPSREDSRTKLCRQCPECGKTILSKRLKVHMMTHAQEGSNPCKICNKSFKRTKELKAHLRSVHDLYDCDECSESFSNIALLRAHYKTHYRCVMCNKACKSEVYLAMHDAIWHPRNFGTS